VTKWLQCAALLAVTWLAGESAWTVRQVRPHLEVTLTNLDRTIIVAGVAATHLEKGSDVWLKSSKDQSSQTTQVLSHANAVLSQLSTFVTSTDKSFNATLLPAATNAINQQNAALLLNQEKLAGNLSESQKILSDSDKLIVDLAPKAKESMDNVATSSANLATATREGAASMTDVHTALDYELKQLMAPVTKLRLAGNIALNVIRHLYF